MAQGEIGENLCQRRARGTGSKGINTRREPIIFVWHALNFYPRWKIYAKKNIVV
jgi:hypothetical protein